MPAPTIDGAVSLWLESPRRGGAISPRSMPSLVCSIPIRPLLASLYQIGVGWQARKIEVDATAAIMV